MGRFIVFEGIDGCGKTTQIGMLEKELAAKYSPLRLREPGGTPVGERVREILADPALKDMSPMTECLLFMAARAQLIDTQVRPALAAGRVVILDRYYYSTAAYQGAAGRMGVEFVLQLAEQTFQFPPPDLVILLDVEPQTAVARRTRVSDRMELKGTEFQEKVREAYLKMAKRDPIRFHVVNALDPVQRVHDRILDVVKHAL